MSQINGDNPRVYRSRVDKSGRVSIPAELRGELGIAAGSAILVVKDDEGVHLESPSHAAPCFAAILQDACAGWCQPGR